MVVPASSIESPWWAESLTYCSRGIVGTRLGRFTTRRTAPVRGSGIPPAV